MKKAILSTLFVSFALTLISQVDVEPDNLTTESTPFLCRPGVNHKSPGKGAAIGYTFNPEFSMRAPSADSEQKQEVESNHRFGGKIKIPLVNRDNVKFMLGFKYGVEKYNFEDIDPENDRLFQHLNNTLLRKSEAAAYLVLPINEKHYTSFRFSAGYQGDYQGFVSLAERYVVYRAAGIFGVKKNENLEYGLGLMVSKNIRRTSVLPFGFINYTINDKWGIEAAVPANMKVRRNFAEGKMMLFGLEYSSQNYALNVPQANSSGTGEALNNLYHYRRGFVQMSAAYLHQTSDWAWLEFKLGYAIDLNSDARDFAERQNYSLQPTGSILGTVTFFISPPKKYLKSCAPKN